MPYKYIKWYHWLWIWVLTRKTAVDVDKRGSAIQTTTVKYVEFNGVMYVIGIDYGFEKSTKKTRKANENNRSV